LKKAKAKERDLNELLGKLQQAQQEREQQLKELQALVRDMGGMSVQSRPEGDYIVIENTILFDPGKIDLSEKARKTLDSTVVAYLKKNADQMVRIDGHTDGVPIQHSAWKDNYHLGAMRAHSVMSYLMSKGIPPERMAIVGYGPNRPLVKPAQPKADTPKNRRVEILIVPKAHKSIEEILDEFQK
jgi:chemotaxis protein MotB